MSNWIEIGPIADIPALGSRIVRTAGGDIAIFRNAVDEVFALDDRCPHKGGPLSQGIVHGRSVTCPLHNFIIDLESGMARAPDSGCTHVHQIEIKDGIVHLLISNSLKAAVA